MKVFLSWSGDLSHGIATAFRDWIPQVLNKVVPYVSSEDIDKGERWSTDIARELEASSFGIVCVTPGNLSAPWVHFEAGALSKTVERSNVVPFLFRVKRSEVHGPLLQFQSALYEKDEIQKLVSALNRRLPEEDRRADTPLAQAFEVWWPHLKAALDALPASEAVSERHELAESRKPTALLEEILELARNQHKILRSPELLIPADYMAHLLRRASYLLDDEYEERFADVHHRINRIRTYITSGVEGSSPDLRPVREELDALHDALHSQRRGMRRRRSIAPDLFTEAPKRSPAA